MTTKKRRRKERNKGLDNVFDIMDQIKAGFIPQSANIEKQGIRVRDGKKQLTASLTFQDEPYKNKIPRNENCPCGSRKKYKSCCLNK